MVTIIAGNHLKRRKPVTKTEWLEARKKGVGGSEVADVMNLEPYGCAARPWRCLECKCPGRNTFKTIQREGLPYSWILQMQHYLYVCDLQWGAYAIQCCDPWEFDSFVVQRDNELIELSLEACHNFWRMVENGPRPDRLGQEDRRCKACNRTKKCYGLEEVPEPEAITDYEDGRSDINLKTAFLKYIEAGEIEKEAAEYKSECKNNLVDAMGERGKVITDVGKVIYSRANRSKFNANRFKATVSDEEYQKFVENYQVNSIRVYPI